MTRKEPKPDIFEFERALWDARMRAMLGMQRRNFGDLAEDSFEFLHMRWMNFCKENGLGFIPVALGY